MATRLPWQLSDEQAAALPRSDLGMRSRGIAWLTGGKVKTVEANFSGSESVSALGTNLYGVDGVNPAFVYDGTMVRFIETGLSLTGFHDNPNSIAVLPAESLALGYENGTLLLSSLGSPTVFDVSAGAAEIAISDEIVDLATQPNDVLAIFCRRSVRMLVGKTVLDMKLSIYSERLSVTPWTLQTLGDSVFLTDDGISRLTRVQEFGDFRDMSLSAKVKPLLDKLKRTALSSWAVASRNEYRLLFENGLGVIIKFNGVEVAGISTFNYGRKFNVVCSAEKRDRQEVLFAGDLENGYVYRLEHGRSFDGAKIEGFGMLAYHFLGSPEHRKRVKKIQVEVDTDECVELLVRAELDYSSPEAPTAYPHELFHSSGGGFYDLNFFSSMLWADQAAGFTDHYIQGVGRNVSLSLYSSSDKEPPHILSSVIYHWSPRGRRR